MEEYIKVIIAFASGLFTAAFAILFLRPKKKKRRQVKKSIPQHKMPTEVALMVPYLDDRKRKHVEAQLKKYEIEEY